MQRVGVTEEGQGEMLKEEKDDDETKKWTYKSCQCEVFGGKSISEWLQKTTNRSSFQLSAPSLRFNSSLGKMYSPVQFPNDFCLSLIMAQCHIVSILFTTTVYNIIQKYLIFCIKDTKRPESSKNSAIKIDDARLWYTAGQSINITNTSNDNKHPCMSLKATDAKNANNPLAKCMKSFTRNPTTLHSTSHVTCEESK